MLTPLTRSLPAAVAALATGAFLVAIAMSQGGYDVVDRQTVGVVLWWFVGLTAVVAARRPTAPALSGILATIFAAGIAVWIALNIGRSISEERTVVELGRAVTHLAPLVLLGWALPARLWRNVLVGLLVGAVLVCAAAFGSRISPGLLGQSTAIVFGNTTSRLDSPLGYWNGLGSWAVITAMLLIGVSAHALRWWQRSITLAMVPLTITVGYLTYSRSSMVALAIGLLVLVALSKRRWTAVLHVAAAAAAGIACVLVVQGAPQIADASGTSGADSVVLAVVGTGALLAALAAATLRLGLDRVALPMRAARIALAVAVVAAIAGGGIATDTYGQKLWDKFSTDEVYTSTEPTARLTMINNGARVEQWNVALDSWRADKAHGTGAGTFELTYNVSGEGGQFVRDAHSAFLEALSEQGTIGFAVLVAFVLALIAVIITAVRKVSAPLDRGLVAGASAGLVAFLVGTSIDWFWELTALALYALTIAGALIAAGKGDPESVAPQEPPSVSDGDQHADGEPLVVASERAARGRGRALRVGLVLVALIAVVTELPGLIGTSEVRRSQRAVTAGDLVSARGHADQAIDILPSASSPFLQRALVDEQAGAWDSARRSLQLAIRRDPEDWRLPLVLSRIEAKAGRPKSAIKAYRQAKALRPLGEFFR